MNTCLRSRYIVLGLLTMESRKRGRKYCEHCDSLLAKSTYYLHRSQFYDTESNVWRKDIETPRVYASTSSESDSEMADDLRYYCMGDNKSQRGGEQFASESDSDSDESPLELHGVQGLYEVYGIQGHGGFSFTILLVILY